MHRSQFFGGIFPFKSNKPKCTQRVLNNHTPKKWNGRIPSFSFKSNTKEPTLRNKRELTWSCWRNRHGGWRCPANRWICLLTNSWIERLYRIATARSGSIGIIWRSILTEIIIHDSWNPEKLVHFHGFKPKLEYPLFFLLRIVTWFTISWKLHHQLPYMLYRLQQAVCRRIYSSGYNHVLHIYINTYRYMSKSIFIYTHTYKYTWYTYIHYTHTHKCIYIYIYRQIGS